MLFNFFSLSLFCCCFVIPLLGAYYSLLDFFIEIATASFAPLSAISASKLITSLALSLGSALLSNALALSATFFIGATFVCSSRIKALIAPLPLLLSIPHSAFAIGLAALLVPSGFLMRLFAPFFTLTEPPALFLIQDPYAGALTLTLFLKETAFLLLALSAAASQLKIKKNLWMGSMLGYHPFQSWTKLLWPQLYPKLKLPLLITLAYSLSPLEISLIMGPSNPPPFITVVAEWLEQSTLENYSLAAWGAFMFLPLMAVAFLIWQGGEKIFSYCFRHSWLSNGRRKPNVVVRGLLKSGIGKGIFFLVLATSLISLGLNFLWSLTARWSFPSLLPTKFTLRHWQQAFVELLQNKPWQQGALTALLFNSVLIAALSTAAALLLSLLLLEQAAAQRLAKPGTKKTKLQKQLRRVEGALREGLLYLPLIFPSLTFIFGLQSFFLKFALPPFLAVTWGHFLFVFPYCYLLIAPSYKSFPAPYLLSAKSLGKSALKGVVIVKWGMLLRPLLGAGAVGFSVSFADYLVTTFLGEGRIITLTTEAVNLSAGGNRRLIGVYATLQLLIPLTCFLALTRFPNWLSRPLQSH